jgi:hypothetical protein
VSSPSSSTNQRNSARPPLNPCSGAVGPHPWSAGPAWGSSQYSRRHDQAQNVAHDPLQPVPAILTGRLSRVPDAFKRYAPTFALFQLMCLASDVSWSEASCRELLTQTFPPRKSAVTFVGNRENPLQFLFILLHCWSSRPDQRINNERAYHTTSDNIGVGRPGYPDGSVLAGCGEALSAGSDHCSRR